MTISAEKATEILVHYIKIALARELSNESHDELTQAIKAFADVDKSLYQLHSHHP